MSRHISLNLIKFPATFFLVALLFVIYSLQLQEENLYDPFDLYSIDTLFTMLMLLVLTLLTPYSVNRPSDFFVLVYSFFVAFPYSIFHGVRSVSNPTLYIFEFLLIVSPLIVVKIGLLNLNFKKFPKLLTERQLVRFILVLSLVGSLLALLYAPQSAGFDLLDSYTRRFEGRDVYSSGTFMAYLNDMVINGFVPCLAFFAGYRKRKFLVFCAIGFCLIYFYLVGLKAPFFYVVVGYFFGASAINGKISKFPQVIWSLVIFACGIAIFELLINSYSYISDFIIRRSFTVPAYLMRSYFDYIYSNNLWSVLTGIFTTNGINYEIGEVFLGSEGLNANTNAFLNFFVSGGWISYLVAVLFVCFCMGILDSAFVQKRENPVFAYIAFSYSLLLTEQTFSTALLSSGIGILIMISLSLNPDIDT